jgi:hypothetical protein
MHKLVAAQFDRIIEWTHNRDYCGHHFLALTVPLLATNSRR